MGGSYARRHMLAIYALCRGSLELLRVHLIQVGGELVGGGVGSGRGHHGAIHTLREGPCAATGWLICIVMLLLIKGHALQ